MRSLMTLAVLMPMTFAVAQAAPAADRQLEREETRIQPFPYPRHCPEGTHRAYDEYARGYICVPNNEFEPRPLPWRDRMKELSGALGGDDMSAKGSALNGLFDAALSGRTGAVKDAVAAPASNGGAYALAPRAGWRLAHTDPSVPLPPTGGKPRPVSREEARFIAVGAFDDLGNKLRDRNDEKLKEATKEQKDTEKRWKDYKEGKSVSPHKCPGCSDTEIAMTGKG